METKAPVKPALKLFIEELETRVAPAAAPAYANADEHAAFFRVSTMACGEEPHSGC